MASNLKPTQVERNSRAKAPPQVPLIDLSELDSPHHEHVVEALINAVQTCGVFQVVNHGLSLEFLEELKDLVHRFFNQPTKEKTVHQREFGLGPLVMYIPSSDTYLLESFLLRYTNEEEALQHWPDLVKEMALKYQKLSSKLAETVVRVLLSNIGVTFDDSMVDAYMGDRMVGMNYFITWHNKKLKHMGVFEHKDTGLLTVLLQDDTGGLKAKLQDGEWADVTPIPGALVIMAGDCLEVLSNGKYKACEHSAYTTGEKIRVSISVFMVPRTTTKIRPLPQLVDKDGDKPPYKEFVFGDYESGKISLSDHIYEHEQAIEP